MVLSKKVKESIFPLGKKITEWLRERTVIKKTEMGIIDPRSREARCRPQLAAYSLCFRV